MKQRNRRITPATFTCQEATRRHRGNTATAIGRMCTRGAFLALRYGGPDKVPIREIRRKPCLFAVKVGRYWQIPVEELDRVFSGGLPQKEFLSQQEVK